MSRIDRDELIEHLAALEHARWADWEVYRERVKDEVHPSGEPNRIRWERQRATPYRALTEIEKDSDRKEARKTVDLLVRLGVLSEDD